MINNTFDILHLLPAW